MVSTKVANVGTFAVINLSGDKTFLDQYNILFW